jgi:divalent metal cation (Fe/Co/Zn/Cd) transporter
MGFMEAVRRGKDPSLFTVVFEDLAAMAGLVVALVGIFLGQLLEIPWADGAAAIVIAAILAAVAVLLAIECKAMLIGEAADPAVVQALQAMVEADPRINRASPVLTVHFGPHDLIVAVDVDFVHHLSVPEVEQAVRELEAKIKASQPDARRVFIEARQIMPGAGPPEAGP